MQQTLSDDLVESFRERLAGHPVYAAVESLEDLRCFMQHHVYSVWDFMSLIKYLQSVVAPAAQPWDASADAEVRRFINELVLEEETDRHPTEDRHTSHFGLYLQAMHEVGADTGPIRDFVQQVRRHGIDVALTGDAIPAPSRAFTRATFDFIAGDRPHVAAAALALGREHVIPGMFRAILARTGVGVDQAPVFHAYLNRHIHLDADFHAPLSLRLLDVLCADDAQRIAQARDAATRAVEARLALWDGVSAAITARRAA